MHGYSSFYLGLGWPWYWWGAPYYGYYGYYGYPAYYSSTYYPASTYYDGPAYYDSTQVYVEPSGNTAPATPQSQYYCPDSGYYPAVQACPRGWLRVVPGNPPPR